jgi:hypothetical protein
MPAALLSESGQGLIEQVRLRPFPFPFRAGLAIASDIDRCERDAFIRLHRYLNCPRDGLGLPVSDSFFGVGRRYHHMAYFQDDGRTPSADAELIRLGLAGGLIDTLHSWGAFDFEPPDAGFLRRTAECLTETLMAHCLRVPVWSDHGAPINYQNLYARTEPRFAGDDPASPYYTGDLLGKIGIRFVWGSELVPWPSSGCPNGKTMFRSGIRLTQNVIKNLFKRLIGRAAAVRKSAILLNLAWPFRLRDGNRIFAFNRYNRHPQGIWGQPTRHTLRHSLHHRTLEALLAEQGYLIVYTHLGMPPQKPGDPLFPAEDAAALENLAAHYRTGRIWVAPTAVLLRHWLVREYLRWSAGAENEHIIIRIDAIDDPTTGSRPPESKELAGIAFYTPRPERTVILVNGRSAPRTVWPPDVSGRACVGFPPPGAPDIEFLPSLPVPTGLAPLNMKGEKK